MSSVHGIRYIRPLNFICIPLGGLWVKQEVTRFGVMSKPFRSSQDGVRPPVSGRVPAIMLRGTVFSRRNSDVVCRVQHTAAAWQAYLDYNVECKEKCM